MLKLVLSCILSLLIYVASAAPPKHTDRTHSTALSTTTSASVAKSKIINENLQLAQPHYITLEGFESLLRRAGELFRPYMSPTDAADTATDASQVSVVASAVPYAQMQPPAAQPFNFYLPLFQYEPTKLDAKSKIMEHFAPPPLPSKHGDHIDYYAVKPRKLPKKFNAGAKHVNMKWLNAFEKEALNDAGGQLPKAVYLLNDERNRINFDDSFFGVDMQVKMPSNQPHGETRNNADTVDGSAQTPDDYLNQREAAGEDDLIADATVQMPEKLLSA